MNAHNHNHKPYRPTCAERPIGSCMVVLDPELLDLRGAVEHLRSSGLFNGTIAAIEKQLGPVVEERGSLVEFCADGQQYLVSPTHRTKFLEAASDLQRLTLAEVVLNDGQIVKNRWGKASE